MSEGKDTENRHLTEIKDADGIIMWVEGDAGYERTNRHLAEARVSIVGTDEKWTEIGIPDSAFMNCSNLIKIDMPEVDFIGNGAFWRCSSLEELHIPRSVKEIGFGIFGGCSNLRAITVDPDNEYYFSPLDSNCIITRYDATFARKRTDTPLILGKELIAVCRTSVIPENAQIVGRNVFTGIPFSDGDGIMTLPDSVRAVKKYAFSGCPDLRKVIGRGVIFASDLCADKNVVLQFSDDCLFVSN